MRVFTEKDEMYPVFTLTKDTEARKSPDWYDETVEISETLFEEYNKVKERFVQLTEELKEIAGYNS